MESSFRWQVDPELKAAVLNLPFNCVNNGCLGSVFSIFQNLMKMIWWAYTDKALLFLFKEACVAPKWLTTWILFCPGIKQRFEIRNRGKQNVPPSKDTTALLCSLPSAWFSCGKGQSCKTSRVHSARTGTFFTRREHHFCAGVSGPSDQAAWLATIWDKRGRLAAG